MKLKQKIGFAVGIIGAILILLFVELNVENLNTTRMAAVAFLMAVWWITEAIPLAATSLLPLVLFPIFGILNGEQIAASYINSTIFLFLGGFIIALSMEKWNFHKRIALRIILLFGGKPNSIVLGFMTASAFLSMWISNTATAVMMLPIGLAIIHEIEENSSIEKAHNLTIGILLGIAYSCSIGGITTLIGTPPNLSFVRILHIIFPSAPEISFAKWIQMVFPISIIIFTSTWFLLTKVLYKIPKELLLKREVIMEQYSSLGKISFEEKSVGLVFLFTALLWVFRLSLNLGFVTIPGWSSFFPNPEFFNDGTVAIGMALILFFIPTKNETEHNMLLDHKIFQKVPWGIILLFGGGFALAKGFIVSGLSESIGNQFVTMKGFNPFYLMLSVGTGITFLTELTSNTATAEMILPILASISVALGLNPLLLMMNATISASMAFMLPVATPPNAVIFASNRIKISEMVKAGILLNLLGIIIISLFVYLFGTLIFDINLSQFPDWAVPVK
jgi:sodium-dependent dicarboxylate transporter 2/3/5